jgi:hypothetical protein
MFSVKMTGSDVKMISGGFGLIKVQKRVLLINV